MFSSKRHFTNFVFVQSNEYFWLCDFERKREKNLWKATDFQIVGQGIDSNIMYNPWVETLINASFADKETEKVKIQK